MQRRWMATMVIAAVAELAARTAAPQPSPILVPAEERLLSTRVITRGTGRFGSPQRISLIVSMLKPGPGVLAGLAATGATLAEGTIVASGMSGRDLLGITRLDALPALEPRARSRHAARRPRHRGAHRAHLRHLSSGTCGTARPVDALRSGT